MPYTSYPVWNGYNIVNFPTSVGLRSFTLTSHDQVAGTASPYSGVQYTYSMTGADTLSAEIAFPPLSQTQFNAVQAWLLAMRGRQNVTWMANPNAKVLGNPQLGTGVTYASTTGTTIAGQSVITTTGWKPSTTGLLLPGDNIGFGISGTNSSFHTVIQQVDSDSSGNATMEIYPSLRFAVPSWGFSTTPSPSSMGCYWRLVSNDREYSYDWRSRHYAISNIKLVEAR